jgi:hypothetical protein
MAAKKKLDLDRVRKLIVQGWNIREISDSLGCNRITLLKRCREAGIELPTQRHREGMPTPSAEAVAQPTAEATTSSEPPSKPRRGRKAKSQSDQKHLPSPLQLAEQARIDLPRLREARNAAQERLQELDCAVAGYERFVESFSDAAVTATEPRCSGS